MFSWLLVGLWPFGLWPWVQPGLTHLRSPGPKAKTEDQKVPQYQLTRSAILFTAPSPIWVETVFPLC
jgi:hypothetical protein